MYGLVGLSVLVSVGLFFVLDTVLRLDSASIVWAWRGVVFALTAIWLVRFVAKEKAFVEVTVAPAKPTVAAGAVAALSRKVGGPPR